MRYSGGLETKIETCGVLLGFMQFLREPHFFCSFLAIALKKYEVLLFWGDS